MEIIFKQCNNSNYRTGRTEPIKYIVIHYTANNGDTAANNADYFANYPNLSASAHYFVDEYNTIYQTVKDTDTAWHCGTSGAYRHPYCRNNNSIGIELCSRKYNNGGYYFKSETVNNAIALTKKLMTTYNIPIENILRHYDVTGKNCPEPYVSDESAWIMFKNRLVGEDLTISQYNELDARLKLLENKMVYGYIDENMPEWARPTIQKLVDKGALKGNAEGNLNLTDEDLRTWVILDRLGILG